MRVPGLGAVVFLAAAALAGSADGFAADQIKDAGHTVQVFTAVRIVFKDEKLVGVRTWPRMESSSVSGGSRLIR